MVRASSGATPIFLVMLVIFQLILLSTGVASGGATASNSSTRRRRTPVIGILSEPFTTKNKNTTHFMIAASYVKWLELGGARSIAIPYDATIDEVTDIFETGTIDGVLFPGGGGKMLTPAAMQIWNLANKRNDNDGFFPIWGTCLGFEYLVMLASGREDILDRGFDAENISLPLTLQSNEQSYSRLYHSYWIKEMVQDYNITLNNHHYGISPEHFRRNRKLDNMFDITSMNWDRQGSPFVSTIEPKDPDRYPYYGVQYHPEKNAFEYATYPYMSDIPYETIDHSREGLQLASHLAQFFVNLTSVAALRNDGRKSKKDQQSSSLPAVAGCSYPPVYTYPRKVGVKFQEYYVIPSSSCSVGRIS